MVTDEIEPPGRPVEARGGRRQGRQSVAHTVELDHRAENLVHSGGCGLPPNHRSRRVRPAIVGCNRSARVGQVEVNAVLASTHLLWMLWKNCPTRAAFCAR